MVNVNVVSMLGACDRWLNPSVVMKTLPKYLKIIWLFNLFLTLSITDEGYSRNMSCTLNLIHCIYFCFIGKLIIGETDKKWQEFWMIESFCCDETAYFIAHVTIFSANICLSFSVKVLLLPHISNNNFTESIGFGNGVWNR
jgi:hypothetical protein